MHLTHYPFMHPKEKRLSGKGRFLVLDSEAIGLTRAQRTGDLSSMHCLVVKDDTTQEVFTFFDPYEKRDPENREVLAFEGMQDGYLVDGLKFLMQAECLISQNFSGYDAHSFEKVGGKHWHYNYMEKRGKKADKSWYYPNKVMDTYTMSTVLCPERKIPKQAYALKRGNVGPHSIEAHGIRIGRYKPDNEDWSKLTDHMLHRCEEDVHIGQDFYHYLMKEWMQQASRINARTGLGIGTAYRCELQVAFAVARQALRGFRMDFPKSLARCEEIDIETTATEEGFRPHMPLRLKRKALAVPVGDCTHGSYHSPQYSITKKLPVGVWCRYSQSENFRGVVPDAAWPLMSAGKVTNKEWLAVFPNTQMNDIGEYTAAVTKVYPECRGAITDYDDPLVVGPFTPITYEEIPLGNRDSVKQILYEHGWVGVTYNDTEQGLIDDDKEDELKPWAGKIDEKSIDLWKDRQAVPEWCLGIARWYILQSRRNQILNKKDVEYYDIHKCWPSNQGKRRCRGLLPQCFNADTGITAQQYYEENGHFPTDPEQNWRAPAEAFPCATNTHRMRHKVVVNIPSRGLYPLRDLFIAAKGKKVIGCDGSGLELRMLAHFLNDATYTDVVLNGDIHTHNQNLAGLPIRDMAKTFIYAL